MMSWMDNGKQKCKQVAMSKFVLLLNGDVTVTKRLKGQISGAKIVAVDGGMRHADKLEVTPECWIGDFDSSTNELQEKWAGIPQREYLVEKNQTDGELALDYAVDCGATDIVLVGGIGGQSDHAVCVFMQMVRLANRKIRCFASNGNEEASPLVAGSWRLDIPIGSTVSIAGLAELQQLTLSGVKWPLKNKSLSVGSTLTMSNKVTGLVSMSLGSGYGIVFVKDMT